MDHPFSRNPDSSRFRNPPQPTPTHQSPEYPETPAKVRSLLVLYVHKPRDLVHEHARPVRGDLVGHHAALVCGVVDSSD